MGKYRGGFAWQSDPDHQFNYHPVFMTVGMIFFYGDAILAYRVFRGVKKIQVKLLHASLLALSLIFASIGLKAVFDSHNLVEKGVHLILFSYHFSLHSWVGLAAVVLFGMQWVCGFVSFLFPKLSEDLRKAYMPSHKFYGKAIFICGISAALMGITELACFGKIYPADKTQRTIINLFGVLIIIFGIIIIYLVANPGYQRPPDDQNEHVQLTN
ncbi:unnamed protein product [Didymodactylos carnosus]|uniref:Cytochrome b561 domain-containing protein n=1 Tax=Didymodactylos carnosus TaxID=1234261 RepID=A0A813UT11_9BILA|nr:unnamed protein product [Didymodactylos carnosus]CAF0827921.1 unnamed protein product [Didymodactylos carnosus]CAF3544646.1 unnamed protein product [Didymodactylos carnosus]CAF3614834.1 unnamed protein product [Didymodactylos carnosus]